MIRLILKYFAAKKSKCQAPTVKIFDPAYRRELYDIIGTACSDQWEQGFGIAELKALLEFSGRAEFYDPEAVNMFPVKMRKLPKVQKVPYATALCGIEYQEFDQAITSMCKSNQGKQTSLSIERCIKKVREYTSKNYFTLTEIMEMDNKKSGKKSRYPA